MDLDIDYGEDNNMEDFDDAELLDEISDIPEGLQLEEVDDINIDDVVQNQELDEMLGIDLNNEGDEFQNELEHLGEEPYEELEHLGEEPYEELEENKSFMDTDEHRRELQEMLDDSEADQDSGEVGWQKVLKR